MIWLIDISNTLFGGQHLEEQACGDQAIQGGLGAPLKNWKSFFQAGNGDSKPKLFYTNIVKVKHGLIVIKDENGPEGLKVLLQCKPS